MIQIVDSSERQFPSLRFTHKGERRFTGNIQQADDPQKHRLEQIVKKYRQQHYVNTFRQKIKRNNIYQPPVRYQLMTNNDKNHTFLHVQGIQIKSKTFESFIFAGDILFTLIIFYISVFQAFLQDFSVSQSSSILIIILKVIAIAFEFWKILIKSIKKDIVNGKLLTHIDEILWNSTGIFELLLYSSALLMILLTIIYPLNYYINVLGFFIATIKLFKIPINLKVLDLHYITSHRKQCYWNLIKVIIFELIFMHFVAAILLAMSSLHEHNWLVAHSIEKSNWDTQYFWALYYSATLVTTTGFGDFVAINTKEAIIVAFLELFSSVVLAYNLNLIGTIVMSLRESDQSLQKKLAVFRRINDQSPLSTPLQQKINSHIDHERQIHENFQFIERQTFLDELPEQLRAQYKNDINQTIFQQLPYFGCLRLETLNNLALQFTSKVCYPKENLIPNKEESTTIHILKRGAVCFQFRKTGATFMNQTIIETLKTEGTSSIKPILLSTAFLSRSRLINYDITAQEYSLIMSLPQMVFMQTIRKSDIEKEHFFTIYDKHESNFVFEAFKCQYCNDEFHSKFQCSKLHYIPFKSEVVRRYIQQDGKKQGRILFLKQVQRKQHCYYLRKSYYQPYEGYKNIAGKHMSPAIINRFIRMKSLAEKFEGQDLLQSFENIFRKVVKQQKMDPSLGGNKNIEVDALHDYLSYFNESNPKELNLRRISRKIRAKRQILSKKLTLLATNSKKHLYRNMNQFDQGYEQQFFGDLNQR